MLSTPEAVRSVYTMPEGVLAGVSNSKAIIDCATLAVEDMEYLASTTVGSTYDGEVSAGLRHGAGKMVGAGGAPGATMRPLSSTGKRNYTAKRAGEVLLECHRSYCEAREKETSSKPKGKAPAAASSSKKRKR